MIERIDGWVLALHQKIIDLIQKKPRWCSLQAMNAFLMFWLMRSFHEPPGLFWFVLMLVIIGLLYWAIMHLPDEVIARWKSVRWIMVLILIINISVLFAIDDVMIAIIRCMMDICMVSYYTTSQGASHRNRVYGRPGL